MFTKKEKDGLGYLNVGLLHSEEAELEEVEKLKEVGKSRKPQATTLVNKRERDKIIKKITPHYLLVTHQEYCHIFHIPEKYQESMELYQKPNYLFTQVYYRAGLLSSQKIVYLYLQKTLQKWKLFDHLDTLQAHLSFENGLSNTLDDRHKPVYQSSLSQLYTVSRIRETKGVWSIDLVTQKKTYHDNVKLDIYKPVYKICTISSYNAEKLRAIKTFVEQTNGIRLD